MADYAHIEDGRHEAKVERGKSLEDEVFDRVAEVNDRRRRIQQETDPTQLPWYDRPAAPISRS